jgi:hypothetical protein
VHICAFFYEERCGFSVATLSALVEVGLELHAGSTVEIFARLCHDFHHIEKTHVLVFHDLRGKNC